MQDEIMPGDRVLVFDPRRYINDVKTPLSMTMRPATVVRRYGMWDRYDGERVNYPDVVDVQWENGSITKAHFTDEVEKILSPLGCEAL
jgi:hypothetical protein